MLRISSALEQYFSSWFLVYREVLYLFLVPFSFCFPRVAFFGCCSCTITPQIRFERVGFFSSRGIFILYFMRQTDHICQGSRSQLLQKEDLFEGKEGAGLPVSHLQNSLLYF